MSTMLPSTPQTFGDIRHVFSSCLSAVLGEKNHLGFRPVRQAVCVLVDGLGSHNIRERAGHAPFLSSLQTKQKGISAGFPSTTATSITSFATALTPGEHGIVGYRIQDPKTKQPMNLLSGWNNELKATDWKQAETISEKAHSAGVRNYFVGMPEYANSGFTSITMPNADYLPARSIEESFNRAIEILAKAEPSLTYLYLPQLDQTAHAFGWGSAAWSQLLEQVDAGFQLLSDRLKSHQGACLTADHGVLDVPETGKIYLDEFEQPVGGISLVGGDTRAAMIYLNQKDEARNYSALLSDELGPLSWVLTKEQLVETGWYGNFAYQNSDRLADITLLAKSRVAFYHRDFSTTNSLKMVGHHGSITDEELQVPLLRLGQFV